MKNPWKKLSSKIVYKNRWMTIIEDKVINPNGGKGKYAYAKRSDGVIIIPMTEKKEIYMVEQWRYPIQKLSLELPMGGIDKGETPQKAAKRECWEEVDLKAKEWKKIGVMRPFTGATNMSSHIFLAQNLSEDIPNCITDKTEMIIIKKIKFSQIEKLISDNKIFHSATIAAFYKLKLFLKL